MHVLLVAQPEIAGLFSELGQQVWNKAAPRIIVRDETVVHCGAGRRLTIVPEVSFIYGRNL